MLSFVLVFFQLVIGGITIAMMGLISSVGSLVSLLNVLSMMVYVIVYEETWLESLGYQKWSYSPSMFFKILWCWGRPIPLVKDLGHMWFGAGIEGSCKVLDGRFFCPWTFLS